MSGAPVKNILSLWNQMAHLCSALVTPDEEQRSAT